MAGEATVPVQHYPDEFDVFHLAHAHSALEAPTQLIFAERGYVIDCIIVGIHQAGGSGALLKFRISTDQNETSSTPIATVDVYTGVTAGDTFVLNGDDGAFKYNSSGVQSAVTSGSTVQLDKTANFMAAGTWLSVEPVSANQLRCSIRVRYRSRFK